MAARSPIKIFGVQSSTTGHKPHLEPTRIQRLERLNNLRGQKKRDALFLDPESAHFLGETRRWGSKSHSLGRKRLRPQKNPNLAWLRLAARDCDELNDLRDGSEPSHHKRSSRAGQIDPNLIAHMSAAVIDRKLGGRRPSTAPSLRLR